LVPENLHPGDRSKFAASVDGAGRTIAAMNRYEAPTLPRELEALVPILAKVYARILVEHSHHRSTAAALEHSMKALPERRMLLRISEVAEALSISRSSAYVLIHAGEIPVLRIGRSVRVSADDLQAWIRASSSTL